MPQARITARLKAEPAGALPFGISTRGTCNAYYPNPSRALERFIWAVRASVTFLLCDDSPSCDSRCCG